MKPDPVSEVRQRVAAAVSRAPLSSPSLVANEVFREVAPVVLHATNNEPWYQSRVTWGAIISIAGPVLAAFGIATDWLDPDLAVTIATAAVGLVGGVITLYGRWKARKPIGQ